MFKSMDDRSTKELRFRVLILTFPLLLGLVSQISGLPCVPAPRPSVTHPGSSAFCLTKDIRCLFNSVRSSVQQRAIFYMYVMTLGPSDGLEPEVSIYFGTLVFHFSSQVSSLKLTCLLHFGTSIHHGLSIFCP